MSSRFTRTLHGGSGCYTCRSCGKRTRDTGDDEAQVELCRKCHREALADNYHSDHAHTGPQDGCTECAANGYGTEYLNG